jgi:hypothetical protein
LGRLIAMVPARVAELKRRLGKNLLETLEVVNHQAYSGRQDRPAPVGGSTTPQDSTGSVASRGSGRQDPNPNDPHTAGVKLREVWDAMHGVRGWRTV